MIITYKWYTHRGHIKRFKSRKDEGMNQNYNTSITEIKHDEQITSKGVGPSSYGLLLAVIWIPIGIIIYMNYLAGDITMKYILYFYSGCPSLPF